MKVWWVTPEVAPYSKTGGLGDVCGSLPRALEARGIDVTIVTPLYKRVREPTDATEWEFTIPVADFPRKARVRAARLAGAKARVFFVENDPYFGRPELYGTAVGDFPDNAERFSFLDRAALELARAMGERPDLWHLHDWQAALTAVYLRTTHATAFPETRSILTIHNIAYQGCFDATELPKTGLDWKHYNMHELEFYGRVSFLKGGVVYADAITTVSPTYAREIQTPEYGAGLEGALRHRGGAVTGILNGVDYGAWSPEADPHVPRGRAACKAALQKAFKLEARADAPLFGMTTRLAEQKGIDLVVKAVDGLVAAGAQLAILGSGDAGIQDALAAAVGRHPKSAALVARFDEPLAHLVVAGADMVLMPSRYEPCGLTQLHALRYGTVPVVRHTGGLADTVVEGTDPAARTGFTFKPATAEALLEAAKRAIAAYRDKAAWARIGKNGMALDFSWTRSAKAYRDLYENVRGRPRRATVVG